MKKFRIGLAMLGVMIGTSLSAHDETKVPLLGKIGFEELKVANIIIGMEPYERIVPQDILVDLKVTIDLQKISETNDIASSVNYVKLADLAAKEAREGEYLFIDVLAQEILRQVFADYPQVEEAFIRIQKPAAIPDAKSGGLVEISSKR